MKISKVLQQLRFAILLSVAFGFVSGVAQAQGGAALFTTKACVTCHGVEGRKPINDNIPKLAGQNKGYLIQQITDIKSGARNNGLTAQMKLIAAGLSDDEIKAIATYLSKLVVPSG